MIRRIPSVMIRFVGYSSNNPANEAEVPSGFYHGMTHLSIIMIVIIIAAVVIIMNIDTSMETIQKSAVLGTAHILRKVLAV